MNQVVTGWLGQKYTKNSIVDLQGDKGIDPRQMEVEDTTKLNRVQTPSTSGSTADSSLENDEKQLDDEHLTVPISLRKSGKEVQESCEDSRTIIGHIRLGAKTRKRKEGR